MLVSDQLTKDNLWRQTTSYELRKHRIRNYAFIGPSQLMGGDVRDVFEFGGFAFQLNPDLSCIVPLSPNTSSAKCKYSLFRTNAGCQEARASWGFLRQQGLTQLVPPKLTTNQSPLAPSSKQSTKMVTSSSRIDVDVQVRASKQRDHTTIKL